jgi:hypothetical protein
MGSRMELGDMKLKLQHVHVLNWGSAAISCQKCRGYVGQVALTDFPITRFTMQTDNIQ